jgi:NAD+ diphosphatase
MEGFVPGFQPPPSACGPALWFVFRGQELLVDEGDGRPRVPLLPALEEIGLPGRPAHYLGDLEGRPCFALDLDGTAQPPPGMAFVGMRPLLTRLEEAYFWVAGRAIQILQWDRDHRYCGRCATPLEARSDERVKSCPGCGLLQFPRISPAVLVLVHRGEQLLLARPPHFAPGYYSIVAGFVESGETLEEAAAREVREEVGIEVARLRYFGSQPWPFPHNLMVGFTAQYAGGDVAIDRREIEDARWFTAARLPELPRRPTLSRRMIDWFLDGPGRGPGASDPEPDPHATDRPPAGPVGDPPGDAGRRR